MPASTTAKNDHRTFAALCLATLGVVYGDIGTSPLYTVSEIFFGPNAIPRTPQNAIGATSLVLWVLTLSVSVKYILLVLRANHEGQGGTFALLALLQRAPNASPNSARRSMGAPLLGGLGFILVLAAGLLFGEGIITPAISVLSAVEGLKVATDTFEPLVVPATAAILIALFSIQRRGTARVGAMFGPAIAIWFIVIAPWDSCTSCISPASSWRWTREAPSVSCGSTVFPDPSRSWGPFSLRSRAARRSSQTWVTSVRGRSGSPGSHSSILLCC